MNDLVAQTNRKLSYPGQQVNTVGLCAKVEAVVCYETGFQSSHSVAAWYASANAISLKYLYVLQTSQKLKITTQETENQPNF